MSAPEVGTCDDIEVGPKLNIGADEILLEGIFV